MKIFCDVAACRSFSKAAELHGISQPAVSQAVHSLEESLDVTLIDRSKRPLDLTPAGSYYLQGVREILASFEKLEQNVREFEGRVSGTLRVSAIYSAGLLKMDRILKTFREEYPDVKIEVEYAHPEDVYKHLLDETAEVGLVSFPRDGGEFHAEPWQAQKMVLVTDADHAWSDRTEIELAELNGEAYIAFSEELPIRREMNRWLKKAGISMKIVHEFDTIENIKRDVEVGAGIALLPLETVQRECELGLLRAISIAGVDWTRPLGIVTRRKRRLSIAARKFIELLQSQTGNLQEPEPVTSDRATLAS